MTFSTLFMLDADCPARALGVQRLRVLIMRDVMAGLCLLKVAQLLRRADKISTFLDDVSLNSKRKAYHRLV